MATVAGAWAQGPPLVSGADPVPASAPQTAGNPAFAIKDYRISGNTLLPDAQVRAVVAPFVGPQSNFDTIQQALEALKRAYLDAGFGAVRVVVPEQEVDGGVVALQVIEATLGSVRVEGQQRFSEANIRAALPALREGQVVNVNDLASHIRLANESPSRQLAVTFQTDDDAGSGRAQVQALVRVVDDEPLRMALSWDNSGNGSTGPSRTGFLLQHANLWDADHALTAQVLTSPTQVKDVLILGIGYRIPLYMIGAVLDFNWGHSNVNSGQVAGIPISGRGTVWGARYSHNLASAPGSNWEQRVSVGLDLRSYDNSLAAQGVTPRFMLRPLTLAYSANLHAPRRDMAWNLALSRNLPGGASGSDPVFQQARAGAKANYMVWKFSGSLQQRLDGEQSLRLAASGQYSRDVLLSAEQFGLGGADSVRGLAERELPSDRAPGDSGLRLGAEWWGADLRAASGPGAAPNDLRLQPIGFVDVGRVWSNRPGTFGERRQSAASVGLGLRGQWRRSLSLRLDWARVLHGTTQSPRGSSSLHAQALYFF